MNNANESLQALRFIRCGIAAQLYCLHMSWVRSIQRVELMQPNPAGQGPAGWLANGGEEIPIFRLATLLQQPAAEPPLAGKIVLLKTTASPWGMLVDRVESIIDVPAAAIFPVPDLVRHPETDWFDGVIQHEDSMLLSLSVAGLQPGVSSYVAPPLLRAHGYASRPAPLSLPVTSRSRRQLLGFLTAPAPGQTSPIRFALSISQVPQVLQTLTLTSVAGSRAGVRGLTQWRAQPLVVIDLDACLGGAPVPVTPTHRLLIARAAKTQAFVGIPILPQVKMYQFPLAYRASTQAIPWQESFLRGRFDCEHDTLVIPDIDRILHAYGQRRTALAS